MGKDQLASVGRDASPSAIVRTRSLRAMKIGNEAAAPDMGDLQLPADFELDTSTNPLINRLWEAVSSDHASPIKGMSVLEELRGFVQRAGQRAKIESGSDSSGHGPQQNTDISESEYTTPGHSRPGTREKPTVPDMATKIDLLEGELKNVTAIADKRLRIILNLLTRLDSDDLSLNQEAQELSKERLFSHLTQSQVENQNMRDYIKMLEDDLKELDVMAQENKFLKEKLADMQRIVFINPELDGAGAGGLPPHPGRTEVSELFDEQPNQAPIDVNDGVGPAREMSPTSRQIISQMKSEDYQREFARKHGLKSHESFGFVNPQPDFVDGVTAGGPDTNDYGWNGPDPETAVTEMFDNGNISLLSGMGDDRNPSQQIFELSGQVNDLTTQVEKLQEHLANVVDSKTNLILRSSTELERLRSINKLLKREVRKLKEGDYTLWIKRTINAVTNF